MGRSQSHPATPAMGESWGASGQYGGSVSGSWSLVVPLALGAAVSPAVLTIQLLLLAGNTEPLRRGWAYAVGITITTIVYVAVLGTVARGLTLHSSDQSDLERIIKLLAAAALAALGVRALRSPKGGGLMRRVQSMGDAPLPDFIVLGVIAMMLNLSSLALMLPAVHLAVNSGSEVAAQLTLISLCAIAPAVLPVLFATSLGSKSKPVLSALNNFTSKHSAQISAAICFLFVVLLVISAVRS